MKDWTEFKEDVTNTINVHVVTTISDIDKLQELFRDWLNTPTKGFREVSIHQSFADYIKSETKEHAMTYDEYILNL